MSQGKLKPDTGFRPSSMGGYLTQAGWKMVPGPDKYPLWKLGDGEPKTGKEAYYEFLRGVWRKERERQAKGW